MHRGAREQRPPRDRGPRINTDIRGRRVRVIDPDGNQLGILTPEEALTQARARGLDLVEVSPNSQPPVCRIMDYGKFKYEESKREREARKKQHVVDIKELRLRPKIDDHDFATKMRNARRFLEEGNKVKIAVRFRGREIVHRNLAEEKLSGVATELAEVGVVERSPSMEGRQLVMILAPNKQSPSS
ncbi:MAG TPA: translation initiation factor IF-3 [Firmicutes bacterium]|nr:translation initiation factor IF-3 [Bacillota bacterium]